MELASSLAASTALVPVPHHLLQQSSYGPTGLHYRFDAEQRFPRQDAEGVCWQPSGYVQSQDYEGNEDWLEYEDPSSQTLRADCDTMSWMQVCQVPLSWDQVDCNIYAQAPATQETQVEESQGGLLPLWVVIPVQIIEVLFQMTVVVVIIAPFYLLLAAVALVDWLLDWIFIGLFVWWCPFCVGLFVWIINIVLIPFHLWGWIQRLQLEAYSFIVDGWMLLFGGSGCFLRWGENCWFAKRIKDRETRTYWDIVLLTLEGPGALFTNTNHAMGTLQETLINLVVPPDLSDPEEIKKVGQERRQVIFRAMPGYNTIMQLKEEFETLGF